MNNQIKITSQTINLLNEFYGYIPSLSINEMKEFQNRNTYTRIMEPFFNNIAPNQGYIQSYKMLEYYKGLKTFNCHIGQLKLFYALFEFLLIAQEKKLLEKSLIVYIGAAAGFNIYANMQYFPNTTWLLYDPAKFDKRLFNLPNVVIKTKKDGFFDNSKIDEVKTIQKQFNKEHIIFISDIRLSPDEESIIVDNEINMKGVLQLCPILYQLKFRVPYFDPKKDMKTFGKLNLSNEELDKLYGKRLLLSKPKEYVYLKGDIYYQLFAPVHSAETRLVGEPTKSGKYEITRYNVKEHEANLFKFNVSRNFFDYSKYSELSPLIKEIKKNKYVSSFEPTYDNIGELYTIDKYLTIQYSNYKNMSIQYKYNLLKNFILNIYHLIPDMKNRREKCIENSLTKKSKKLNKEDDE